MKSFHWILAIQRLFVTINKMALVEECNWKADVCGPDLKRIEEVDIAERLLFKTFHGQN